MIENNIGSIICKLRKEKGLTQKELADVLNVSDKAISRWETGNSYPDLEMIFQISKFFNVSFNDLLTARMETDSTDDELMQEIINEFTEMNQKNSKRIKIVLFMTLVITLILIIAIIFTNTYNKFKVYRVTFDNNEFVQNIGTYIETNIKDTLYLGSIKIKGVDIKETDIVSADLYILDGKKEKVIQTYFNLNNLRLIGSQSYFKIDNLSDYFNNLYLKIKITDSKDITTEYVTKLKFALDFSNNKIFYSEEEESINYRAKINLTDEVENNLLNHGFELKDNIFYKKSNDYEISFYTDLNNVIYIFKQENYYYKNIYYLDSNILEVSIINESNIEIENYKYDVSNDKIIACNIGKCNNYKEILAKYNEAILNYLK